MSETQNDLLSLNGRTALVTGGTGGIGTAICQVLAGATRLGASSGVKILE